MRDVLTRLEKWLRRHSPATLDGLGPGLMQLAIDMYQKDLGHPFPAGLRALNDWHYGVLPDRTGRILGRYEHVKLNAGVRAMRDDVLPVFAAGDESIGWHVPSGRVIATPGDGERTVIAPDFDTYLTAYVESLEAGMWTVASTGELEDAGAFAAALAARFPPTPFVPPPKPVTPAPPPEPSPIAYAPATKFAVGNRVSHPSFGIGTVRAVTATKADIEFAAGTKTLVHARSK